MDNFKILKECLEKSAQGGKSDVLFLEQCILELHEEVRRLWATIEALETGREK